MASPILTIKDLSLRIGATRLVDGISLSVKAGETLALVGASGSGKSLSLLAATGLGPAHARVEGEVIFDGEALHLATAKRLRAIRGARIGFVFQDPQSNLHPYKTIFTQIAEIFRAHGLRLGAKATRAKVAALLNDVGIHNPETRMYDLPRHFSGGMRQRVMIAMALAMDPALLIADEPTTALDVTVQAKILNLIKDLQLKKGLAVLFVSHDLAVVSDIADRIAIMSEGRIVESGASDRILTNAQHPVSRKLLAAAGLAHGLHAAGSQRIGADHPLLTLQGIRRNFGRNIALDGIDLTIERNEILALVGESGSGKSTLGRIIAGLDRPASGQMQLAGAPLTLPYRPNQRQAIQVIFQDPYASLNPRRSIAAILADPLRRAGLAYDRTAISALLTLVRLDPALQDRLPSQLSGGQRQRVAVARALAPRPQLIIADEPVSALDIITQAEILGLLRRLSFELDLSLLLITHDLGAVGQYCDRVAVLQNGSLVETGAVSRIFAAPSHDYTRSLLAAVPGRKLRQKLAPNLAAEPRASLSEHSSVYSHV